MSRFERRAFWVWFTVELLPHNIGALAGNIQLCAWWFESRADVSSKRMHIWRWAKHGYIQRSIDITVCQPSAARTIWITMASFLPPVMQAEYRDEHELVFGGRKRESKWRTTENGDYVLTILAHRLNFQTSRKLKKVRPMRHRLLMHRKTTPCASLITIILIQSVKCGKSRPILFSRSMLRVALERCFPRSARVINVTEIRDWYRTPNKLLGLFGT